MMPTTRDPEQSASPQLPIHLPVPWAYVLAYLVGVGLEQLAPLGSSLPGGESLSYAGLGVFVAGAILAGWGWVTFFKAGTTTVPGRVSSELVTWGPYRCSRNPMYVGLTIAYLGEAGILHQLWPVLVLPLALVYVNWIVLPVEEARLTEVFGSRYLKYKAEVRRWL